MSLLKNISNIPGWRTKRKMVVFESDDWGAIRMPDIQTQRILVANGIRVDKNYFTLNDTVESAGDIESLADLLSGYKDHNGKSPVFTTLHIMGNPDFDKIEEGNFTKYYWHSLNDTYETYQSDSKRMYELWMDGIQNGFFYPSFHGREHLNVSRWMKGLRKNLPITKMAFKLKLTGIQPELSGEERGEYQAAFDIEDLSEVPQINKILLEGLQAFEAYFGYGASFFVPPNGFFPKQSFNTLAKNNVRFINTKKISKVPNGDGTYSYEFRKLGEVSEHNLIYLTRNVYFEPSAIGRSNNWVDKCMKDMSIAFTWGKPAIISTHRVNYISGLNSLNRDRGLKHLDDLLKRMLKKWPDIEFFTSSELGDHIASELK